MSTKPGKDQVVCVTEESAKNEAKRQQALEDADEAEWIYLKNDGSGRWLARRVPRDFKSRHSLGDTAPDALLTLLTPFH